MPETGGQFAGILVQYDGDNGISYKETRRAVEAALAKVNKTYQWTTNEPKQFDVITAQQIQDLLNAADVAYDAYASNCSSKYGSNCNANDGYGSGNATVYSSNLTTVYSGVNSGYNKSNLSAKCSSKNISYS